MKDLQPEEGRYDEVIPYLGVENGEEITLPRNEIDKFLEQVGEVWLTGDVPAFELGLKIKVSEFDIMKGSIQLRADELANSDETFPHLPYGAPLPPLEFSIAIIDVDSEKAENMAENCQCELVCNGKTYKGLSGVEGLYEGSESCNIYFDEFVLAGTDEAKRLLLPPNPDKLQEMKIKITIGDPQEPEQDEKRVGN